MLHRIVTLADRIMSTVATTLKPTAEATSKQVRLNGLATFAIGIALFVLLSMALLALLKVLPNFRIGPLLLAPFCLLFYALSMVGGYRALTGRSPVASYPGEVSFKRLFLGLFSVGVAGGVLVLIALGADYVIAP